MRLAAGVVLLLLALVLFGASRLVAAGQRHAYDPGASPRPTYHLSAARSYQLSTSRSVAELKVAGLLTNLRCSLAGAGGTQHPLTLSSTMDDDRNLHLFAAFTAPVTGDVHVSCTGIPEVFVDDADDAGADWSALLVLLSSGTALLGLIAAGAGGYGLSQGSSMVSARRSSANAASR